MTKHVSQCRNYFYYLFRINSQKLLNIFDIQDSISLLQEIVIDLQSRDIQLTECRITSIVDVFAHALYRHFEIDSSSRESYNLELRTIIKTSTILLSGYEGCSIRDIPVNVFDEMRELIFDVYSETEPYTDETDIRVAITTLSKSVPSDACRIINNVIDDVDQELSELLTNALKRLY